MTLQELLVRVGADISSYAAGVDAVKAKTAEMEKHVQNGTQKVAGHMHKMGGEFDRVGMQLEMAGMRMSAAITLPLVGLGTASLTTAANLEQMRVAVNSLTGSAERGGEMFAKLKEFAATTPFQFPELVDATKRLIALGFTAEQVIPMLRGIGDAVAALGGGKPLIDRVTKALGDMHAKGTVQTQEMRQLAEAGINAWEILAKTLKVDVTTAMKMVENRAVDAATGIDAIMRGLNEKFAGMMGRQMGTLAGMWSNIKDQATFALDDIGQALLPIAKEGIKWLSQMLDWAKDMAHSFAQLDPWMQKAILGLAALVAAGPPLLMIFGGMATSITSLAGAFGVIIGHFGGLTAIWASIAAGAGSVVSAFAHFGTSVSTISFAVQNNLVGALSTGEMWMLRFAKAIGIAAAAGVGWKLGEWIEKLVSTDYAKAEAQITRLNEILRQHGLAVERGSMSLREWAAAVLAASQNLPSTERAVAGVRAEVARLQAEFKAAEGAYKNILMAFNQGKATQAELAVAQTKLWQASRELAEATKDHTKASADAGEQLKKLKEAAGKAEEKYKLLYLRFNEGKASLRELSRAFADLQRAEERADPERLQKAFDKMAEDEARAAEQTARLTERLAELDAQLEHSTVQITNRFNLSLAALQKEAAKEIKIVVSLDERLPENIRQAIQHTKDLEEAAKRLGIQHQKTAEQLQKDYELIRESGRYTAYEVAKAEKAALEATINEHRAVYGQVPKEQQKRLNELERQLGEHTRKQKDAWDTLGRQMSTIFTDMSRSIADIIVKGGKLKDVFKNTFEEMGKAVLRFVIEYLMGKLLKALLELIDKYLPKLAGALGGVFGGAKGLGSAAGLPSWMPKPGGGAGGTLPGGGGGWPLPRGGQGAGLPGPFSLPRQFTSAVAALRRTASTTAWTLSAGARTGDRTLGSIYESWEAYWDRVGEQALMAGRSLEDVYRGWEQTYGALAGRMQREAASLAELLAGPATRSWQSFLDSIRERLMATGLTPAEAAAQPSPLTAGFRPGQPLSFDEAILAAWSLWERGPGTEFRRIYAGPVRTIQQTLDQAAAAQARYLQMQQEYARGRVRWWELEEAEVLAKAAERDRARVEKFVSEMTGRLARTLPQNLQGLAQALPSLLQPKLEAAWAHTQRALYTIPAGLTLTLEKIGFDMSRIINKVGAQWTHPFRQLLEESMDLLRGSIEDETEEELRRRAEAWTEQRWQWRDPRNIPVQITGQEPWEHIRRQLEVLGQDTAETLRDVYEVWKRAHETYNDSVRNQAQTISGSIRNITKDLAGQIGGTLRNGVATISEGVKAFRVDLGQSWDAVIKTLWNLGARTSTVFDAVRAMWDKYQTWLEQWRATLAANAKLLPAFRDMTRDLAGTIGGTLRDSRASVSEGMKNFRVDVGQAWQDVVKDLWNLGARTSTVFDAVRAMWDKYQTWLEQWRATLAANAKLLPAIREFPWENPIYGAKQKIENLINPYIGETPWNPHGYPPQNYSFNILIPGGTPRDYEVARQTADQIFRELKTTGRRI